MKTESFVFYTSWLEAIDELDEKDQLPAFKAIMKYQAYHEETEVKGAAAAVFKMAKPLADELYSRRQASQGNGKKGGRPKTAQSGEEPEDKADNQGEEKNLEKPSPNLEKPRHNLEKPSPNLNGNVNGNGNGNGNVYLKELPDCSAEFNRALKDFSDMRKKIKKPLTDRAKQMILNKLSKLSPNEEEQIAILNQSVLHSWQDVYPLKSGDQRAGKTNAFEELMKV